MISNTINDLNFEYIKEQNLNYDRDIYKDIQKKILWQNDSWLSWQNCDDKEIMIIKSLKLII